MEKEMVGVRYIVKDVEPAIDFYTNKLDFKLGMKAPGFAMLDRGNLRLFINQPGAGGAGKEMPDGAKPAPGGWNRIQIVVDDLEKFVDNLKHKDASFRNEIVKGVGGDQILLQDPSGNLIELFMYPPK